MGESFLGLPNRFKIVNNLYELAYNPNHALSAYQGYVLSTDYVKRTGGMSYCMKGTFYTLDLSPNPGSSPDIGNKLFPYNYIYADVVDANIFTGNAATATKLQNARKIELKGAVTGSVTTDLGEDVVIITNRNHNHDDAYIKKIGNTSADPVTGTLWVQSLTPTKNNEYSVGRADLKYYTIYGSHIYADTLSGELTGNASSATKLKTARTIKVILSSTSDTQNNSGVVSFDGSRDVTINVGTPFLHLTGGTISGSITLGGGLHPVPSDGKEHSIGSKNNRWSNVYANNIYATSISGNLTGNAGTASSLVTSRNIKVVLTNSDNVNMNYGSTAFDGSKDIEISVWCPYLPINGGTIRGGVVPSANSAFSLGSSRYKFSSVYADSFEGNAASATKLATSRAITIGNKTNNFDGSGAITFSLSEIGAAAISHGNHVPSIETANNARFLRNDNTWQTITPANIGALPTTTTHLSGDVPTSRKINGKSLSSDITLSYSDVGAAPSPTVIVGKYHSGMYVVGTKTGWLESGIQLTKGTWLIVGEIRLCIAPFRIITTIEARDDVGQTESRDIMNMGNYVGIKDNNWMLHKPSGIVTISTDKYVYMSIDTRNISSEYEGMVYDPADNRGLGMQITAFKLK